MHAFFCTNCDLQWKVAGQCKWCFRDLTNQRWVSIHRDAANLDQQNDHDREVQWTRNAGNKVLDKVAEIEMRSTIERMAETTKRGGAKLTELHAEMEQVIVQVVAKQTMKDWRPSTRKHHEMIAKTLKMPAVTEGEDDDEDEEDTAMDTDSGAPDAAVSTPVAAPPSDDVDVTSGGNLPNMR